VDYAGKRQFISSGNLAENPKAYLDLIDYAHRRRIKIWGPLRVVGGCHRPGRPSSSSTRSRWSCTSAWPAL
jgi:hypothetical protein